MKKISVWLYLAVGIVLCLVLTLLAYFYLDYATSKAMPSVPLVSITGTYPESPVSADQSVVVFGEARDPDGIAEVQLWVNGEMIASQANSGQGSNATFEVSQSWIPTGAGNYLVLLRAIDGKGRSGQSDPTRVEVGERAYIYDVEEGDTVETIAQELGTTPVILHELNPDIGAVPDPGTLMDVPGFPADYASDDDTPRVDPPPAPPPPSGAETPVEPSSPSWWTLLPLPENFACLFNPMLCSTFADEEPASTPIDVNAALYDDACKVLVTWQDRAENEIGFQVYRSTMGSRTAPELVELLNPVPGNGERVSYVDENMPNGRFFYAVSAINSTGESWSPPSNEVSITCNPPSSEYSSLTVEALEMTVRDPFERLYCYVSLAGSPFERVPNGSSFLESESGVWNIAEYFSGENSRRVLNNPSRPLDIIAECLGWQEDTLVNLGRFSRFHPAEEWDGRTLIAGPSDGSFNVTYRINTTDSGGYGGGGGGEPVIDPSIPPPFDLHETDYAYYCTGVPVICLSHHEPGIGFWINLPLGIPEPISYKFYGRRGDEDIVHHFVTEPDHYPAPQAAFAREDCDVPVFYSVSSVIGYDSATGAEIESSRSEELEVSSSCPQLEITLIALHVFSAPDGDPGTDFCVSDCGNSVEAYGWLSVGNRNITWNNHCDPSLGTGCLTSGPSFTDLPQGTVISWENEFLSTGSGSGMGQNVFRIPIEDDQTLSILFDFWDHDYMSPDDLWCGWDLGRTSGIYRRQSYFNLEPRSLEEWLAIDQDVEVPSPNGNCQLALHVRGVPR